MRAASPRARSRFQWQTPRGHHRLLLVERNHQSSSPTRNPHRLLLQPPSRLHLTLLAQGLHLVELRPGTKPPRSRSTPASPIRAFSSCAYATSWRRTRELLRLGVARRVFDEMPKRTVARFNALFAGLAQRGEADEARRES
uniref:Uncharacterized protein n=2 Tax=Oryza TaxID=4527 RepID=A0A0D3F2G2_9ORYZ